jgi:hypothetical protein
VCIGSGNTANEIGPVLIQADHFAKSPESEQRHTTAYAALAIDGVSLGQLVLSRYWLVSIGRAGLGAIVNTCGLGM